MHVHVFTVYKVTLGSCGDPVFVKTPLQLVLSTASYIAVKLYVY